MRRFSRFSSSCSGCWSTLDSSISILSGRECRAGSTGRTTAMCQKMRVSDKTWFQCRQQCMDVCWLAKYPGGAGPLSYSFAGPCCPVWHRILPMILYGTHAYSISSKTAPEIRGIAYQFHNTNPTERNTLHTIFPYIQLYPLCPDT